jgi:hypothetical protein
MKQSGGLILPYNNEKDNESVFWDYLKCSTVNYTTRGGTGIVFQTTPKPEFDSLSKDRLYFKVSPDESYGEPVKNILIKIVVIFDTTTEFVYIPGVTVDSVTEEEFKYEINTQAEIYSKTIEYLQPICPGIVYSAIMDVNDARYDMFLDSIDIEKLKTLMARVKTFNTDGVPIKIGIIGTELITSCSTLSKSIQNINNDDELDKSEKAVKISELKNVCRYILLDLALKTGYNHGDFHDNNFMIFIIDNESREYFKNVTVRPILIDFGRAFKITPEILRQIKECVSAKRYSEALAYLCDYRSSNHFTKDPAYASQHYGWVCGDYNFEKPGYIDGLTNDLLQSKNADIDAENAELIAQGATPSSLIPHETLRTLGNIRNLLRLSGSFNKIDNKKIEELFDKREETLNEITQKMSILHDSDQGRYPLLPLSNDIAVFTEIQNKLYKGMVGGIKKQKKSKRKSKKVKKVKKCKKSRKTRKYKRNLV